MRSKRRRREVGPEEVLRREGHMPTSARLPDSLGSGFLPPSNSESLPLSIALATFLSLTLFPHLQRRTSVFASSINPSTLWFLLSSSTPHKPSTCHPGTPFFPFRTNSIFPLTPFLSVPSSICALFPSSRQHTSLELALFHHMLFVLLPSHVPCSSSITTSLPRFHSIFLGLLPSQLPCPVSIPSSVSQLQPLPHSTFS